MARYITGRLAALLPVLAVVGVTAFLLLHLIPGDPAAVILGTDASPAQVARLRHEMGLDRPLLVQLAYWFARLLQGDLGDSIFLRQGVASAIWDHLGPTLGLTALAELLAVGVAIPSGVAAAWKRNSRFDQAFMSGALLGVSVPSFWMGVKPPTPTWGNMLDEAHVFVTLAPWFIVFPGAAIVATVLALNLLGDAVRDLVDPHAIAGRGLG